MGTLPGWNTKVRIKLKKKKWENIGSNVKTQVGLKSYDAKCSLALGSGSPTWLVII